MNKKMSKKSKQMDHIPQRKEEPTSEGEKKNYP